MPYQFRYDFWRVVHKARNHIDPAIVIGDLHEAEDHIKWLTNRLAECEGLLADANHLLADKINEVTDLRLRLEDIDSEVCE